MPIYTSLEFFRTKQTIDSFDVNYPKSISGLREAIVESLERIDLMVREINADYLNEFGSQEHFIRDKMISISLLFSETSNIRSLKRLYDFDNVCDMAGGTRDLNVHINKVRALLQAIIHFNPSAFTAVVDLFEKVMLCMDKYLLSFFLGDINEDHHKLLETAILYERQRRQIIHDVKEKLMSVFSLASQFKGAKGIETEHLSERTQQLARRTQSTSVPPLLLFAESCHIFEECRQALLLWLQLDRDYPRNLRTDIETLQLDKITLEAKRRMDFDAFIRQRHRKEQSRLDHERRWERRDVMEKKLRDCQSLENRLLVELSQCEIEMQTLELGLQSAKRNMQQQEEQEQEQNGEARSGLSTVEVVNIHRFTSRIENVTQRKKEIKVKCDQVERRIERYHRQLNDLERERAGLLAMTTETKRLQVQLEQDEKDMQTTAQNLVALQTMLTLKSSSGTLKKIFHNLELSRGSLQLPSLTALSHSATVANAAATVGGRGGGDSATTRDEQSVPDLATAIGITCQMIGSQWKDLYFCLPFHPPRGTQEIENDIAKFTRDQVRGLLPDLAKQSLTRWRRLHSRANLACLATALVNLNRVDIVQRLKGSTTDQMQKIGLIRRRTHEDRPPPLSATTRFIYQHYPHLATA